ncbi:MAG: Cypemycin methyltransferase [bacterium ADurb.Bin429]|nr:MAG: Cypemycin methyltransferase [bacterium ADurb.Bin429]
MSSRRVRPIEETEAAWVPEYFGEEYLRLYQFPPSRTDPEVAFLTEALSARIPLDGRVLDLGCGQGRHAIPLARHGFHVIGLDVQANLLTVAARRARDAEVDLPLVRGDMRRLPFADGSFDAVLCLFSAFGYFADEENARVLAEVARALKPGGWFVLDVANRDALLRHAQPRSWKRLPDGALVITTWRWDVWAGRYMHEQVLVDGDQQRRFSHSVRVYTCTELRELLREVGLTVTDAVGGFRGEALELDAPRLVLIAQRAS